MRLIFLVILVNIQKKFHIYYNIRFLAYNFNEMGVFPRSFTNLATALFPVIP